MSNLVKHIGDDEFDAEVLKSSVPVVVDFWAEWCGPCKMVGPILDQLAQDFGDTLKIVKINVDEHQKHAAQYSVRGIPTLLIFKDGQLIKTQVGALGKPQLSALITQAVA